MKRIGLLLSAATLSLMLAGCGSLNSTMPHTTITGNIQGKPFSVETPKDTELSGLDLSADTNGTVKIHIDKLTTSLNPTNVANAAAGQAAIVSATADAMTKAIQAGASAAGTAIGAAAK